MRQPESNCLGRGGWKTFPQFVVSNRTHDPYWQIWTQLTLRPPAINLENLRISITKRSPAGTRSHGFGDHSLDPVQIVTHDEEGHQFKYLMIESLRPSEYFYFNIVLPATELNDRVELFIDLWSFDRVPSTWGHNQGQPSLRLEFPQPLRGKGSIRLSGTYPLRQ